jgi:hypothetical protein
MVFSNSDYVSLLQNQESSSKERFNSADGESFTDNIDTIIQKSRSSWIPSSKMLLMHAGVILIYTTIFAASLIYVFSQKVGDIPLFREDMRGLFIP